MNRPVEVWKCQMETALCGRLGTPSGANGISWFHREQTRSPWAIAFDPNDERRGFWDCMVLLRVWTPCRRRRSRRWRPGNFVWIDVSSEFVDVAGWKGLVLIPMSMLELSMIISIWLSRGHCWFSTMIFAKNEFSIDMFWVWTFFEIMTIPLFSWLDW